MGGRRLEAPSDFEIAGGILEIDLRALGRNYLTLRHRCGPAEVAAVVKADAYGLGADPIAKTLHSLGCQRFFVALPDEGRKLRSSVPDAQIFVLSGPRSAGVWPLFSQCNLVPVLNSTADIESCRQFAGDRLPVALHIDTGMNRLGLTPPEAVEFLTANGSSREIDVQLLMSHLACADEPSHPLNEAQQREFMRLAQAFPNIDTSLANSAGIMLGSDYAGKVARPGIALYGGLDLPGLEPVATALARILQIRIGHAGSTVGYGAAASLSRDTLIAVAALGYADGLHRAASGAGIPARADRSEGAFGHVAGRRVPILGRISMDLTAFDITDLGLDAVRVGDLIEVFGPNIGIAEFARAAKTIPYEILTSIGTRYHQVYATGECK
jgi:alanine racemase